MDACKYSTLSQKTADGRLWKWAPEELWFLWKEEDLTSEGKLQH